METVNGDVSLGPKVNVKVTSLNMRSDTKYAILDERLALLASTFPENFAITKCHMPKLAQVRGQCHVIDSRHTYTALTLITNVKLCEYF